MEESRGFLLLGAPLTVKSEPEYIHTEPPEHLQPFTFESEIKEEIDDEKTPIEEFGSKTSSNVQTGTVLYDSSDDETVGNLVKKLKKGKRVPKEEIIKEETPFDVIKVNRKKSLNKKSKKKPKLIWNPLFAKPRAKALVSHFLSGDNGSLTTIKYKDVTLTKLTKHRGYSVNDKDLDKFKRDINGVMMYGCEDCDYTNQYLIMFKVHFMSHANIHFIQEFVNTIANVIYCYVCDFKCKDRSSLKKHLKTHGRKSVAKIDDEKLNILAEEIKEAEKKVESQPRVEFVEIQLNNISPNLTDENLNEKPAKKIKNNKTKLKDKKNKDKKWKKEVDVKSDDDYKNDDFGFDDDFTYDDNDDDSFVDVKLNEIKVEVESKPLVKIEKIQDSVVIKKQKQIKVTKLKEQPVKSTKLKEQPVKTTKLKEQPVKSSKLNELQKPLKNVEADNVIKVEYKRIQPKIEGQMKCIKCGFLGTPLEIRTHDCKQAFICHICGKACLREFTLERHMKSHVNTTEVEGVNRFKCNLCSNAYSRRHVLAKHIHSQHCKEGSRICGLDSCVKGISIEFICNECNRKFSSKYTLIDHIDREHPVGNMHRCKYCGLKFKSGFHMRSHRKLHWCPTCPFGPDTVEEIISHRKTHMPDKNNTNADDWNVDIDSNTLPIKKKKYSNAESGSTKLKASDMVCVDYEKPLLHCELCKYKTKDQKFLDSHLLKHTDPKPFSCTQCDFKSSQKGNLIIHEKSHITDKSYACTMCDFQCDRLKVFVKHKKSHGLDENVFMMQDPSMRDPRFQYCDRCEFRSKYPQYFKSHMLKHDNIRPYLCAVCGNCFTSTIELHVHKNTHNTSRQYKCSYCNYSYHIKQTVKIHERKHTGIKPHYCDMCSYSTSYAGNLRAHRKKHLDTSLPPLKTLEEQ